MSGTPTGPGDAGADAGAVRAGSRALAFGEEVVAAILSHMHGDHGGDSTVIVRRHGAPDAVAGRLIGFDGLESTWAVVGADGIDRTLVVAWPEPLTDRASVRRQIVALYDAAL